jgi:hypothetical protein
MAKNQKDYDELWRGRRKLGGGYRPTAPTSMDAPLHDNPHYTDERYRHPQTIFGTKEDGLVYNYSDRIVQWDYAKAEQASKAATASGAAHHTARWYQAYLSAYYDQTIELKHILAGWNWATGYAYQVFGYRVKD